MEFLCDNLYKNFENHNRFDNRNREKVDYWLFKYSRNDSFV